MLMQLIEVTEQHKEASIVLVPIYNSLGEVEYINITIVLHWCVVKKDILYAPL